MHFELITPERYEAVRQFLSEMGWAARVGDWAEFQQMMQRADRTVVALEAEEVVGFGRALCDDVSNGYLSMLAVAPKWRGQGIGGQIVKQLMGDNPNITWVLRAGHGSSGFWERQGFMVSEVAMERTRASG